MRRCVEEFLAVMLDAFGAVGLVGLAAKPRVVEEAFERHLPARVPQSCPTCAALS
ncbi:MAG: hypothetical protein QF890_15705 [Myxococcota bacterium]|nr:hypothetical protein [Myxococcota bacterium]